MTDLIALAKSYYRAYETGDRSVVEKAMAPGFTFTSPFDDHIEREDYFRRCWPSQPIHSKFHFVSVARDGDSVVIVYRVEMRTGTAVHPDATFRNAERMTFENGKLKSVEVFFGDPPNGLTRRQFAEQCGAG
jgi:ketosteroid isomerase-like protein